MFGFGKEGKVTSSIGEALHSQLFRALQEDEGLTNERLMSLFTNGYIISFVFSVYGLNGLNAQKLSDKNLSKILNGVLPRRLEEVVMRQNEMRMLAEDTEPDSKSGIMFEGNQNPKYFSEAQKLAREEAELYVNSGSVESAQGWYNYLTAKGDYVEI